MGPAARVFHRRFVPLLPLLVLLLVVTAFAALQGAAAFAGAMGIVLRRGGADVRRRVGGRAAAYVDALRRTQRPVTIRSRRQRVAGSLSRVCGCSDASSC